MKTFLSAVIIAAASAAAMPAEGAAGADEATATVPEAYRALENAYQARRDSITAQFRREHEMDAFWATQLRGLLNDQAEKFDAVRDSFIQAGDDPANAAILLEALTSLIRNKTVHQKYAMLGEKARNTPEGEKIRTEAERIARISVGGIAPDFTMKTPDGQPISLYGTKGKVKIMDFWASWCGPCRAENPTLKQLYAEYAPKGLEIISVSVDTGKERWTDAIAKDDLPWKHASELGEGTTARTLYNIYAIPHIFVLDENNRILAEQLHGQELIDFVSDLFKE